MDQQTVALYVRPMLDSSDAQQLDQLRAWAEACGHRVVAEYTEKARTRGKDRRQECARMLADAGRGAWSRVACVSLTAPARSVRHAGEILARLDALGIALTVLGAGIDTSADEGRTRWALDLACELERDTHKERAVVGIRRRLEFGLGHGARRIPGNKEARIVALLRAGTSIERTARIVGCSKSPVYRVRAELALADPLPSSLAREAQRP